MAHPLRLYRKQFCTTYAHCSPGVSSPPMGPVVTRDWRLRMSRTCRFRTVTASLPTSVSAQSSMNRQGAWRPTVCPPILGDTSGTEDERRSQQPCGAVRKCRPDQQGDTFPYGHTTRISSSSTTLGRLRAASSGVVATVPSPAIRANRFFDCSCLWLVARSKTSVEFQTNLSESHAYDFRETF